MLGLLREWDGGLEACCRCVRWVGGERSHREDSMALVRASPMDLPLMMLLEPLTRWARQGSGRCRRLH